MCCYQIGLRRSTPQIKTGEKYCFINNEGYYYENILAVRKNL